MPEKGEACRKSEKFNVVTASLTKCKINITSHKKAETAITGTESVSILNSDHIHRYQQRHQIQYLKSFHLTQNAPSVQKLL